MNKKNKETEIYCNSQMVFVELLCKINIKLKVIFSVVIFSALNLLSRAQNYITVLLIFNTIASLSEIRYHFFLRSFFFVSASCYRLVCYYNSSAENREHYGRCSISDIDPNRCTYLIYAFADINDKHELVPTSEADRQRYLSFNSLKTR